MSGASVLSVEEAAARLGLSREGVQRLVSSGQLPADRRAGAWWIDADAVERRRRARPAAGRPLSSAVSWLVLLLASGESETPAWRSLMAHGHALDRASRWLRTHSLPEHATALRNRAKREQLDGHPSEFPLILAHENVYPTGISAAAQVGLHGGHEESEFYAPASFRTRLFDEHALLPASDGSALARWVPDEIWPAVATAGDTPTAAVLVDLLEHSDPRARREATAAFSR